MKRMELFEFEDHPRFPSALRDMMTGYIQAFHRMFRTPPTVAAMVAEALASTPDRRVVDLCSGAGGPMLDVAEALRRDSAFADLELVMTDLYPNASAADYVDAMGDSRTRYERRPVDATKVEEPGVRTLIGSFHHLPPDVARAVLLDAAAKRQPIVVFELSDNSVPWWAWWVAIPGTFLLTLVVTPFVRPLSLVQLLLTYAVPVLPLLIAWDGAASNARTYTPDDVRELLQGFEDPGYSFEIGARRAGRLPAASVYVLGRPR